MLYSAINFPNSIKSKFSITYPPNQKYNCVAWACGRNDVNIWPNIENHWWPPEIPNAFHINSFIKYFELLGYSICDDGSFESRIIKIAIYSLNDEPTHVSRQLSNGLWTSKLGIFHVITHTIEGMSNGEYGNVSVYLKKQQYF